jgi:hypothetical protein
VDTITFSLVLWQTGRKVTLTLHNISVLNVKSLASLNVSGRFLARKAIVKFARAREPRYPRTQ